MKKAVFVSVLLVALCVLAAPAMAQDEPLRVVSVVNGTLGDKSFFDSAQRGMEAIAGYDAERH